MTERLRRFGVGQRMRHKKLQLLLVCVAIATGIVAAPGSSLGQTAPGGGSEAGATAAANRATALVRRHRCRRVRRHHHWRRVCRRRRHRATVPPPPPPAPLPAPPPPSGEAGGGYGEEPGYEEQPTSEYKRVDLIANNGFEDLDHPTSCFDPFTENDGTVANTDTAPLAGGHSLAASLIPYGRIGCIHEYGFEEGPIGKLITLEGQLRIDSVGGDEGLEVCIVVYFESDSQNHEACQTFHAGFQGPVHAQLDAEGKHLQRVFFQLHNQGDAVTATLDEAHLWVEVLKGSEGSHGGGGGGGGGASAECLQAIENGEEQAPSGPPNPNSPCDVNETPPATPDYTPKQPLDLPTQRPFISLADYTQAPAGSPIFEHFENWVNQTVRQDNPGYNYSSTDAVVMFARTGRPEYIEDAIARVDADVKEAENAFSKTGVFQVEAEYSGDDSHAEASGATQVEVRPAGAAPQTAVSSAPSAAPASATQSTTEVRCTPSPLTLGEFASCEATVRDGTGASAPQGEVGFDDDRGGTFAPERCHLSPDTGASASCSVTFIPARQPAVARDSYIDVGPLIEELALAYDYGIAGPSPKLSPDQQARWKAFGDEAISNLWSPNTATWGAYPVGTFPWSAWSVNDPGNNYNFSFIRATQMWALATQDQAWIRFLQEYKFPLMTGYYAAIPGGGSREGTGYGTAQRFLWANARMWRDNTGEDLTTVRNHGRESIEYWVNATVPTRDFYAPIGDLSRQSLPELFDYQENLVREAVMAAPAGSPEARHGVWWLRENSVPETLTQGYTLREALLSPPAADTALEPTALTYHATGVGQFFARSSWDEDATWLQLTAGPYDQSHAHEDQGAFTLYRNTWLAVTSNIWSNSGLQGGGGGGNAPDIHTGANNLVRFSVPGAAGEPSETIRQNLSTSTMEEETLPSGTVEVHADLSPAYSRNSDLVRSWTRDLRFHENELEVHDACDVGAEVTPTFQLNVPVQPQNHGGGSITAGALQVAFDPSYQVKLIDMRSFNPQVDDGHGGTEEIEEFEKGWRIDLTNPGGCGFDVKLTALAAPAAP
jgi:hypothetical protein